MAPDLDKMESFYGETLGMEKIEKGERNVEFDTGACRLKIEADFDPETLAAFGMEPPGENRGDGVVVVLEVDDVTAVHEKATAADADILLEPREVDWGRKMFLVRDPAGYTLEISRPL